MLAVLAGSLTAASIEQLLPLDPDYVGVRGAVCDNTRAGRLNPLRVRELKRLLVAAPSSNSIGHYLPVTNHF